MPEISILLPCYNVEKYLPQCLDSVLAQTFSDFELVCINDGSTDKTGEILTCYAKKDSRIKIITQENKGLSFSRNISIDIAIGKYLWFVDGDDFMEIDAVENIVDYINKNKDIDIVLFDANYIKKSGEIVTSKFLNKRYLPNKNPFNPLMVSGKLYKITSPVTWTKVFKKSFIETSNLRFQNLSSCTDIFFTRMALILTKQIGYINKVLYNYRIESDGSITSQKTKRAPNIIKALKLLKESLENSNKYNAYKKTFEYDVISNINYQLVNCSDKMKQEVLSDAKSLLSPQSFRKLKNKINKNNSWILNKVKDNTGKRTYYLFGLKIFSYKKKENVVNILTETTKG